MKRRIVSFLLLAIFAVTASAQTARHAKSDHLEANLRQHVEYLASPKLAGRRTGTEGAAAAAAYVANQFAKLKLKPGARGANGKAAFLQEFPYTKLNNPTVSGYNVIGILEGRDKELRKEAIVIGAHYDHLGNGGEGSLAPNSSEVHHGADDNASGTAAMLELARKASREKSNKRTLIFIAFGAEESGLIGSKFYVNNAVFPIENTVAMLNMDMVGRLTGGKLTVGGVGTASEWRALLEKENTTGVGEIVGMTNSMPGQPIVSGGSKRFELAMNQDGFGPSDHSSFYMVKVPVLFFFTGTHLDYHKPSDTAEKINYDGQARIVEFVGSIATAVDSAPARPTYTVAPSASPTGGRTGFNITLGTIPGYSDSADGMVIDGVRDSSPASRAGLKANDKIVMLAGKEVKNVQDYTKLLGEMKADVEYDIVVVRGAERLNLKITPAKRQ